MSDEAKALSRVRQRIRDIGSQHGLTERRTVFEPSATEDGPLESLTVFVLGDDQPIVVVDAAFDEVLQGAAEADREAKADKAREELDDLHRRLNEDPKGGFL